VEEQSRRSSAAELWASFPHDPRNPAVATLRASDADRERVHQVLVEAFADGRLDREEYDERTTSVFAARTLGDFPALVTDLIPEGPLVASSGRVPLVAASATELQRRAEEHWRDERRNTLLGFLGTLVFFGAIAAFTTFWVLVVPLMALLRVMRILSNKREIVSSELRRLEKRQAKAIEAKNKEPGAGGLPA